MGKDDKEYDAYVYAYDYDYGHLGSNPDYDSGFDFVDYEKYATEFCEIEKRCNITQVKEHMSNVVSQLMLLNGYLN